MKIKAYVRILIPAAFLVMAAAPVYAQSKDRILEQAVFKCVYLESVMVDTVSRRAVTDTMYLVVGRRSSSFYSQDRYLIDSIQGLPDGMARLRELQFQYARQGRISELTSNTSEYIYQNYPDGAITTRAMLGNLNVEIIEERESPFWELSDSTRKILGYTCHKAEAAFRGRTWTAWYTTEIPVSSGPWKLYGLPGLILDTYDSRMDYRYTVIGISAQDVGDVTLYSKPGDGTFRKIERKQYLRSLANNKARTQESAAKIGFGSGGGFDYRETDYHKR